MAEKGRLEELSKALPEKERKELLERIGKRMARDEGEEAIPVELREEERSKIIAFEMKKANLWTRILTWLRSMASGKSTTEAFVDVRLGSLKRRIRSLSPGLTGFETRDLSPRFARALYAVYLKVQPLTAVYHALGADKAVRGAAFSWYVEQRWEQAKKTVHDFVSAEEMETIFSATGQTEEIRKRFTTRLNDYVRSIPEALLQRLEEQALLHVYCGRLVAYPFADMFRYFNHLLSVPAEPATPPFSHAPVMLTLDLMEKLHVAFSLIRGCGPDYRYAEEPATYFFMVRAGLRPGDAAEQETVAPDLARLRGDLMALTREIATFEAAVPLLDLLRYFRRDPWYQLVDNPPRLFLRSLYFSSLKTRLGQDLEEALGKIKEQVIDRKIQEVLKGPRLAELSHYREIPEFDFRKMGLPYFSNIRSLGLVFNYIINHVKGVLQEATQIVSAVALANNRMMQTRLAQYVTGLEELETRIVLFDRSLSPDEEDGKHMVRFRASVAGDLLLQRSYRAFVGHKDKEARDIIDKARECLAGVASVFNDLRASTSEATRSLLKTLHVYRGRNQTLGQILTTRSDAIGAFLRLLFQLLEIEKGA